MTGLRPDDEAVDFFAGTGWGVALRILGIREFGVEILPEAVATRDANGMSTWMRDVWDVLETAPVDSPEFAAALFIASPPCQTFSMAGSGAGRRALDEVLGLIDSRAYLDPAALREFGERHDPRTALVLTPLTYVARHVPTYVVLEQVPQVLPVWERIAEVLRGWGYSVVTSVLRTEQYGVPQTRKRAILIARADGVEARMPTPTHSRYYERNPTRLDEDIQSWVSMAEALGRGMTARPSMTITSGGAATGGYEPFPTHAREAIEREREAGRWMVSNYSTGGEGVEVEGNRLPRAKRHTDEPSLTVTSNIGKNRWADEHEGMVFAGAGATAEQTAGQRPRELDEPAHTITGKRTATFRPGRTYVGNQKPGGTDDYQRRDDDKPAPTITGSGTRSATWEVNDQSGGERDPDWPTKRPATTIATRGLVTDPGHNVNRFDDPSIVKSRNDGIKVTVAEAAALQTYPATFDWTPPVVDRYGRTKPMPETKAFLQIGNAVPPLLALRVLETLMEG